MKILITLILFPIAICSGQTDFVPNYPASAEEAIAMGWQQIFKSDPEIDLIKKTRDLARTYERSDEQKEFEKALELVECYAMDDKILRFEFLRRDPHVIGIIQASKNHVTLGLPKIDLMDSSGLKAAKNKTILDVGKDYLVIPSNVVGFKKTFKLYKRDFRDIGTVEFWIGHPDDESKVLFSTLDQESREKVFEHIEFRKTVIALGRYIKGVLDGWLWVHKYDYFAPSKRPSRKSTVDWDTAAKMRSRVSASFRGGVVTIENKSQQMIIVNIDSWSDATGESRKDKVESIKLSPNTKSLAYIQQDGLRYSIRASKIGYTVEWGTRSKSKSREFMRPNKLVDYPKSFEIKITDEDVPAEVKK